MNLSNKIFLEDFIFELHRRMSGDVWSWAGQTRRSNKNIGVDWRDIPMHLRYLVDDAKYWVANKTFSNVHIAILFKLRIVKIHCFPNGNGRHSRLMADVIIEKIFREELFTWGSGNLI